MVPTKTMQVDHPKYCFAIATQSDFPDFSIMKRCGVVCCEYVTDSQNIRYAFFTMETKLTVYGFNAELSRMHIVPHQLPDCPLISTFGRGKSKRSSVFYKKIRSPYYRSSYKIMWKPRSGSNVSSTPMAMRHKCMRGTKVPDTESEEEEDVVIEEAPQPELQPKLSDMLPKLPELKLSVADRADLARENERLKDVLAERERYVATLEAQLALKDKQLKALAATL